MPGRTVSRAPRFLRFGHHRVTPFERFRRTWMNRRVWAGRLHGFDRALELDTKLRGRQRASAFRPLLRCPT
jgi:hypothetical protein